MAARWFLLWLMLTAQALPAQIWYTARGRHLIGFGEGSEAAAVMAAKRGEQSLLLFQQLLHRRDATFSTPLRVIVSHSAASGDTLVRTPLANFVRFDPADTLSSTLATRAIATLALEDNYPRAEAWFDSGLTSYLAGARFSQTEMELGAPPADLPPPPTTWMPISGLFGVRDASSLSEGERAAFLYESWAVVRWLVENSRLAQAGAYLNAVEVRGAAPDRALNEAFSMDFPELDRTVRESLAHPATQPYPLPDLESGLSEIHKLAPEESQLLNSEPALFANGGSEAALNSAVAFMKQHQENAEAHRALAWAFLERHDLANAIEHIRRALALDDSGAPMHYLYSLWVNQGDTMSIHVTSATVRLGTELKEALRRQPDYAPAWALLGLAQLEDGDAPAALASLGKAAARRPREGRYQLLEARAMEASGDLEGARRLLLYLQNGDHAVAAEAHQQMQAVGRERKQQKDWRAMGIPTSTPETHGKYDNLQEAIESEEREEAAARKSPEASDDRRTEHLAGRLISVQCADDGSALLQLRAAGTSWQMRAARREHVVLMGATEFNCSWRELPVAVNYKSRGGHLGDLVSLELR